MVGELVAAVVAAGRGRSVDLQERELRVGLEGEHVAEVLQAAVDGSAGAFDDTNLEKIGIQLVQLLLVHFY